LQLPATATQIPGLADAVSNFRVQGPIVPMSSELSEGGIGLVMTNPQRQHSTPEQQHRANNGAPATPPRPARNSTNSLGSYERPNSPRPVVRVSGYRRNLASEFRSTAAASSTAAQSQSRPAALLRPRPQPQLGFAAPPPPAPTMPTPAAAVPPPPLGPRTMLLIRLARQQQSSASARRKQTIFNSLL
jgi:hypothetical protein